MYNFSGRGVVRGVTRGSSGSPRVAAYSAGSSRFQTSIHNSRFSSRGAPIPNFSDAHTHLEILMTRGNQREQDRAKAAKKLAELQKGKQKESAASLTRRREEDAQKMREKQAKALALKADGGGGTGKK
ncbi:hypothetical protein PCANC_15656 [Puccinia coronata f. sp. avenae]|uniref:Small EDRK-rich factor-like N-terminal domain-containing protein n=1 Tax=Puccinia coronata f. sp. avenae TaxID=200324 RepID=A0A2N5UP69_9BASI|nr:hypothetical protein PCASD_20266 [Puccinia coronata f. sp. avenae]PLW10960.1 hypothetical protein PCANC_22219 [Puccinia coronata f. sp. avenae]PLW39555.1 hypothetical protein PCANC_15656 [Puccinia coronata f. sp. avenae]